LINLAIGAILNRLTKNIGEHMKNIILASAITAFSAVSASAESLKIVTYGGKLIFVFLKVNFSLL